MAADTAKLKIDHVLEFKSNDQAQTMSSLRQIILVNDHPLEGAASAMAGSGIVEANSTGSIEAADKRGRIATRSCSSRAAKLLLHERKVLIDKTEQTVAAFDDAIKYPEEKIKVNRLENSDAYDFPCEFGMLSEFEKKDVAILKAGKST